MKSTAQALQDPPVSRARRAGQRHDACASATDTAAILARGQMARLKRLDAPDMVNSELAARLAGATRATINAWIVKGRCIGLLRATRGYRLPAWQFEPQVLAVLPALSAALDTVEGWALLSFLETPHGGLDGRTPRQALEQGQSDRVVALAGEH